MSFQILPGKQQFGLLLLHILLQPDATTTEADESRFQTFGLPDITFLLALLLF